MVATCFLSRAVHFDETSRKIIMPVEGNKVDERQENTKQSVASTT